MIRRLKHLVLLAPALCACGPLGNTLGLDGTYEGTWSQDVDVRVTSYFVGGSATRDEEQHLQTDGSVVIEPAYGYDAVVSGLACPLLPLVVDRGELVLAEPTSCRHSGEQDQTSSGATRRTESESTFSFTDLVVAPGRDPRTVEVFATVRSETQRKSDGALDEEIDQTIEIAFDGFKVAEE